MLNYPADSNIIPQLTGGFCMHGKVGKRPGASNYHVQWYDKKTKKTGRIYRYKGERMYHPKIAEKLLAKMQADVENGTFVLERYTKEGFTDILPFIEEWLKNVRPTIAPATFKGYRSYTKNHINPYFNKKNHLTLQDIQLDVLTDFMNQLPLQPKGKMNVMYCLHVILDYAKRSRRISAIPSFPKKNAYQLEERPIQWLPEDRQLYVLEQIPLEHQPILYFLKYHLRRPAEAIALHKEDFKDGVFTICRSVSARKVVNKTKTGEIHHIPCHPDFEPFLEIEREKQVRLGIFSPHFFICPSGRHKTKRYTNEILNRLWKKACIDADENIDMYSGLKHSSCSQYVNEKGLSESELQIITDHARIESVRRYAKTEVKRKKELMMKNIYRIDRQQDGSK